MRIEAYGAILRLMYIIEFPYLWESINFLKQDIFMLYLPLKWCDISGIFYMHLFSSYVPYVPLVTLLTFGHLFYDHSHISHTQSNLLYFSHNVCIKPSLIYIQCHLKSIQSFCPYAGITFRFSFRSYIFCFTLMHSFHSDAALPYSGLVTLFVLSPFNSHSLISFIFCLMLFIFCYLNYVISHLYISIV